MISQGDFGIGLQSMTRFEAVDNPQHAHRPSHTSARRAQSAGLHAVLLAEKPLLIRQAVPRSVELDRAALFALALTRRIAPDREARNRLEAAPRARSTPVATAGASRMTLLAGRDLRTGRTSADVASVRADVRLDTMISLPRMAAVSAALRFVRRVLRSSPDGVAGAWAHEEPDAATGCARSCRTSSPS
jgi:hypothetical protein